jgi:uncharacterized protein (DUF1810 family)
MDDTRPSSAPGENTESADGLEKGDGSQCSAAAQRLIRAQAAAFPSIIDGLKREGPSKWRKRDHWAWYVFPTTLEGASDMRRTAVKDAADAQAVLEHASSRDQWTEILAGVADAVRTQKTRSVLPGIDHGRVDYFIPAWRGHSQETSKYPAFHGALEKFCKAWEQHKTAKR